MTWVSVSVEDLKKLREDAIAGQRLRGALVRHKERIQELLDENEQLRGVRDQQLASFNDTKLRAENERLSRALAKARRQSDTHRRALREARTRRDSLKQRNRELTFELAPHRRWESRNAA